MKLNTDYFGEIEINEEEIVDFPDGLLAFEKFKKFVLIDNPDDELPFQWLQCIDDPSLVFVVMNPFLFKKDYEVDIPDSVVKKLEIEDETKVAIYSILVIPDDITKMTANLIGPVIINSINRKGKQIVLDNRKYSTKHFVLEDVSSEEAE
jgi:flagellar assembly factor FliW